jgi:RND family efflux transporter MFP subunit
MSARYRLARALQSTAGLIVVCGAQLLSGCDQDVASPEPRQTVSVYQVGSVVLERERQFHGRVVPADITRVAFRIPGKIAHLSVQSGQSVTAGQVLAQIEDSIQRQVLADARAQYDLSERQLARAVNLHERGALTSEQLDQLRAGFRLDQANLKLAEANLSYTVITAPFDGTVADVMKELYESVKAGESIATVYRNDRTDVLVNLPDSLPARVHEASDISGMKVQATFAGSNDVHTMSILKASTARDPRTQSFQYWLTMPSMETHYPPGLMVTVTADLQKAGFSTDTGVIVPLTALQAGSQSDTFRVWRVEDDSVTPVLVRVRQITEAGALVQAGLLEGDLVVTGGLSRLAPGKAVNIQEQDQGR